MPLEIDRYEDMNKYLEKCFNCLFGDGNKKELITMQEVREMIRNASQPDVKRDLPENSLLECPPSRDEIKKMSKKTSFLLLNHLRTILSIMTFSFELFSVVPELFFVFLAVFVLL